MTYCSFCCYVLIFFKSSKRFDLRKGVLNGMDLESKKWNERLESISKSQEVAVINEGKLNSHHWAEKKLRDFILMVDSTELVYRV